MQDAFVAVWERWDRVSGMDEPTGYLYRTAMNRFRSRLRRASRAARRAIGSDDGRDAFAAADERDAVARALARLPERQRSAIVLTELLGYGSEEAGRILGVKDVSVRSLASQARAALRDPGGPRCLIFGRRSSGSANGRRPPPTRSNGSSAPVAATNGTVGSRPEPSRCWSRSPARSLRSPPSGGAMVAEPPARARTMSPSQSRSSRAMRAGPSRHPVPPSPPSVTASTSRSSTPATLSVSFSIEGLGGDGAEPGERKETVWQIPPGAATVSCSVVTDGASGVASSASLDVVDPNGFYIPAELECHDGRRVRELIVDYADGTTGVAGDPVQVVRHHVSGLEFDDRHRACRIPRRASCPSSVSFATERSLAK